MPHKHTRKKTNGVMDVYDLPPSQVAKPLPVIPLPKGKKPEAGQQRSKAQLGVQAKKKHKHAIAREDDDTPRAFKRLMSFSQKRKAMASGNDQKTDKEQSAKSSTELPSAPDIQPGENLFDYSARVDAALPVSGLVTKTVKNGKDPLGLKTYQTRKEKKMHKLYDQWRAEGRKIREKKEEELEMAAERALEDGTLMLSSSVAFDGPEESAGSRRRKRKGKRGSRGPKEEDPWEELRKKRGEVKPRLRDSAKAPPSLSKVTAKLREHM